VRQQGRLTGDHLGIGADPAGVLDERAVMWSPVPKRARARSGRAGLAQGSSEREASGDAGLLLVTLQSVNSSERHLGQLRSTSWISRF
jgi:hypothetical protein